MPPGAITVGPQGARSVGFEPMFVTLSFTSTREPCWSSCSSISFCTPYSVSGGGTNRTARSPVFSHFTGRLSGK